MNDPWRETLDELERADRDLASGNLDRLSGLEIRLAARQAALERIASLDLPSDESQRSAILSRLRQSAAGGAALRHRLLLERSRLRQSMAASQQRRALSQALSPGAIDSRGSLSSAG